MPELTEFSRKSNKAERLIVVHFSTLNKVRVPASFTPHNSEHYVEYFKRLLNVWTRKDEGYMYEAVSLLNIMLKDIMLENKSSSLLKNRNEALLMPAIDCINDNFTNNDYTVEQLAAKCNVSSSYFRRIFNSVYGISPIDYIINKKIAYATELLQTGYYSVKQVSEKCGIPNSKYFSTLYKKKTGHSPSDV